MKPKDLRSPFSWKERRPLIVDGVFYVPDYYEDYASFSLPSWDGIFGNASPVSIEFCSGNGDWIVSRALECPDQNWIAVEKRFDRIRKIWSKCKNMNLQNLFMICGDASTFIKHYVLPQSVEGVYINFPDPWPKSRHEKHRLMKCSFLGELSRILMCGKSTTFVTDDPEYASSTNALFERDPQFETLLFTTNLLNYGSSWFETLWKEKGKDIFYGQYANRRHF